MYFGEEIKHCGQRGEFRITDVGDGVFPTEKECQRVKEVIGIEETEKDCNGKKESLIYSDETCES